MSRQVLCEWRANEIISESIEIHPKMIPISQQLSLLKQQSQ